MITTDMGLSGKHNSSANLKKEGLHGFSKCEKAANWGHYQENNFQVWGHGVPLLSHAYIPEQVL